MGPLMGLMIFSTLLSAGSAGYQQYIQNKQLKYQSKMAERNALMGDQEASYVKEQSWREASEHQKQVAKLLGKQRAAMGASGLVADTGSFENLELDTVGQGKIDELDILYEGDLNAWRARESAQGYRAQSNMYRNSTSSPLAAGLMTGVQQGIGYYAMYKRS